MDARQQARSSRKQELLLELSELMIEEQVEEGVFLGTPHFSVIELAAIKLGNDLSRKVQERGAREVAASCESHAPCPTCQSPCPVEFTDRKVTGVSGPINLTETKSHCRKCRRSFFPSAGGDGTE